MRLPDLRQKRERKVPLRPVREQRQDDLNDGHVGYDRVVSNAPENRHDERRYDVVDALISISLGSLFLAPVVEEEPFEVFAQLGQRALEDLAYASLGQLEGFADLL